VIDHVVQLVSIAYGVALVVATFQQAQHIRDTGTMFTTVDLPLWPGYAAVTLGLVVTVVFMLSDVREVRRGRSSLFRTG
jgi:TRAP-type C4-dicarboxylate transport system permease small subunit